MTFFDIFWYVFNFLSIALVVVFLCMNLTPRFNRYAVFFLTLIPFSAIALAQHYFYDVPSVFFKIPAFAYYFISAIAYFKDKLRTRICLYSSDVVYISRLGSAHNRVYRLRAQSL